MGSKTYYIKVLDLKYQSDSAHLDFRYLTYEVTASHEKDAIKKARKLYMRGQKAIFSEELPFLLKIFSISDFRSDNV